MTQRSLLAALAAFLLTLLPGLSPTAAADPQTDVVTPTGWWFVSNGDLQTVNDQVALGRRIVDIEVESTSPLRFSAVLVRNTGDYNKNWWWYHDVTATEVSSRMGQNSARLIDVEPYETASGIRYAVVMVQNTGSDFATSHGWRTGFASSDVQSWMSTNTNRRILDIQPYAVNGGLRYAFAWVANTGQTQSAYWAYTDVTADFIESSLSSHQARLIDLEPHDNSERFSVVMVPRDGNSWRWYYDLEFSDIQELPLQFVSRITDLQRYRTTTGAIRFAMILRRNANDLSVSTTNGMRLYLPLDARSGFLLRELQGTPTNLAANHGQRAFEPAGLMSTVHHYAANRRVSLGQDSFFAGISVDQGLNGTCPTGTNPQVTSVGSALRSMMEGSPYRAAEAFRARYSSASILFLAALAGATDIELNHTLGCGCDEQRNEITLTDLANIHGAVVNGALGSVREDFYDRMDNEPDFALGLFDTETTLNEELNGSSLSSAERDAFHAGLLFAHKSGAYPCQGGTVVHRSVGAYVRLPFRSGCQTVMREYFIGAWVNDAPSWTTANNSLGSALNALFRDRLRAAIASWEDATCVPFVNYCNAAPNSTGQPGRITATGTPFILENNLVLRGTQMPPNSFASIIFGDARAFVQNPGGSAGNLCVGGAIGRMFDSIGTVSANGTLTYGVDNTTLSTSAGGPFTLMPGDQLMFQWWNRDSEQGVPTSNFTDAVEVTFI